MNSVSYSLKGIKKKFTKKPKHLITDSYGNDSVTVYNTTVIHDCILCGYNLIYPNVRLNRCHLGFGSYINSGTSFNNVFIGAYSSISSNVSIINGQHPSHFISTYPGFYSNAHEGIKTYADGVYFQEFEEKKYNGYTTYIGHDVLIGTGAVLTEGVYIAEGAIVLPHAVVVKDVEPYSIVGGVPAKTVKYRFEKDDIILLQQSKWWEKDTEWLQTHWKSMMNIEEFKQYI